MAKNNIKKVTDYFQKIHDEGKTITEEDLINQTSSENFSPAELDKIREYLESMAEVSDSEMETIFGWYSGMTSDDEELGEQEEIAAEDINNLEEELEEEMGDLSGIDENIDREDGDELLESEPEYAEEETDEDIINNIRNTYADSFSGRVNDPVKMYLKEIGRVPLLKPDEEKRIAYSIHGNPDIFFEIEALEADNASLNEKITEMEKEKDRLSEEDRKLLGSFKRKRTTQLKKIEKLQQQNEEYCTTEEFRSRAQGAKDALTSANLRLVVAIAKKYVGRGLLFLDLIQEGNMGLVKAVEKFEPAKGFKFSTYATWWIRQAITRAIADQARTIRIPVHMVETINKLTRVQRQLVQELGREPTAEEISAKLDGSISPEKVREIQKIALDPVSLETPIGEEDDSHLGDFIEDKDTVSPDEYATKQLLKDEIDNVLQLLTERERKVLQLRFGLLDGRTRTLEEVGKEFNVTRERIRQIEAKALRKLKHPTKSKRLKDFVDKV